MTETATEPTPTTANPKKAKFSHKEKKAFFDAYNETLGKLAAQFPGLSDRAHPCRPLKIGIHHDIAAAVPEMTPEQVSMFCQIYASAPRYRASLIDGAARVDLSGQPVGEVSAQDAGHAERLVAKAEAKLKAAHEQRIAAKEAAKAARKPVEAAKTVEAPATPEEAEKPVSVAPAATKSVAKPQNVASPQETVAKRPVVVEVVKAKRRPVQVAHVAARRTA